VEKTKKKEKSSTPSGGLVLTEKDYSRSFTRRPFRQSGEQFAESTMSLSASGSISAKSLLEQRAPSRVIIETIEHELQLPFCDCQEVFVDLLKRSTMSLPPLKWQRRLLKDAVAAIELSGSACCDELMGLVVQLNTPQIAPRASELDAFDAATEPSSIIYSLPDATIVCRVLRMHNEVGTRVWGAGIHLSEICVNTPALCEGSTVLELGSGVGITGFCLACNTPSPKRVILSDYVSETLDNLCFNKKLNDRMFKCPVDIIPMDWAEVGTSLQTINYSTLKPDVILAADCTYSPDICVLLVNSIEYLLMHSSVSSLTQRMNTFGIEEIVAITENKPFALVASTLRNEETFSVFLKAISASRLKYADVTDWAQCRSQHSKLFYRSDVDGESIKVMCLYICTDIPNYEETL
jgi:hypothetical protein